MDSFTDNYHPVVLCLVPPRSRLSPLFELFAAEQRVRSLLSRAMADSALRPDEYAVDSVHFDEGPQSPSELARRVGMPPTTLSQYVRALVANGHARKSSHPQDGRSFRLELTRSGRAAHAAASRAFAEADRRFLGALRMDEEDLRATLRAVAAAADLALDRLEDAGADASA